MKADRTNKHKWYYDFDRMDFYISRQRHHFHKFNPYRGRYESFTLNDGTESRYKRDYDEDKLNKKRYPYFGLIKDKRQEEW